MSYFKLVPYGYRDFIGSSILGDHETHLWEAVHLGPAGIHRKHKASEGTCKYFDSK